MFWAVCQTAIAKTNSPIHKAKHCTANQNCGDPTQKLSQRVSSFATGTLLSDNFNVWNKFDAFFGDAKLLLLLPERSHLLREWIIGNMYCTPSFCDHVKLDFCKIFYLFFSIVSIKSNNFLFLGKNWNLRDIWWIMTPLRPFSPIIMQRFCRLTLLYLL